LLTYWTLPQKEKNSCIAHHPSPNPTGHLVTSVFLTGEMKATPILAPPLLLKEILKELNLNLPELIFPEI